MMKRSIDLAVSQRLDLAVKNWPGASAREEAYDLVQRLCDCITVDAVVVFGSAVRADVQSYDLDLMYIYHGSKPDVASRRMEIDLRGYSRSEVTDLLESGHDLISWAVRFGELVCEREDYWTELKAGWIDRVPLPSVPDATRRAQKAWTLFLDLLDLGDPDAALEQYVTYLTHRARIELVHNDVFPASRPELPDQLHSVGAYSLAQNLEQALRRRNMRSEGCEQRLHQFLMASKKIGARFNGA